LPGRVEIISRVFLSIEPVGFSQGFPGLPEGVCREQGEGLFYGRISDFSGRQGQLPSFVGFFGLAGFMRLIKILLRLFEEIGRVFVGSAFRGPVESCAGRNHFPYRKVQLAGKEDQGRYGD
jgi:hypothetical protein